MLPSTILNLQLTTFTPHINRYVAAQQHLAEDESSSMTLGESSTSTSGRLLSPLISYHHSPVPRLSNICMNLLISPRSPANLPPLLDAYDWPTPDQGEIHPLYDAQALHEIIPNVTVTDLERVLQTLRTASVTYCQSSSDRRRPNGGQPLAAPGEHFRSHPSLGPHRSAPPDDASTNPWFYPCPSPRHSRFEAADRDAITNRTTRHLFLHPAEERIEWREICGQSGLPIKWMGCSPGCLAFLDEDEEGEWTIEEE